MTTFFDLPEIQIDQIQVSSEITVMGRATSLTAEGPCWGTISKRVQSRYPRTLYDLLSRGRPVRLVLQVRRFFCQKASCGRKIFAEPFPALCRPHAQRTKELQEALGQLGFALGGQAGAAIGSELGISGSRDTILRLVRQQPIPQPQTVHVMGLDDWACKRGRRYGTLICDLERGLPIDLLPDRTAESVKAWLQSHPSIEVVSRDGAAEYAAAILQGAPQAVQVTDRWHLVKHGAACVQTRLAGCRAEIRKSTQVADSLESAQDASLEGGDAALSPKQEQGQQTQRMQRQDQYEQAMTLQQQGLTHAQIARMMGLSPPTRGRWLAQRHAPLSQPRRQRARRIDAYQNYLQQRWQQGCHNGIQLYEEVKAKGFPGSQRSVSRDLASLGPSPSFRRTGGPAPSSELVAALTQATPLSHFTARQATWLFLRKRSDLDEQEQQTLQLIRAASPRAEAAYQVVTAFMQMLRERTGALLEDWLRQVQESGLLEFEPFVTSIQRDRAAVLAGLTLPWNNGAREGQVNRLKLIKRSMYGRAHFDLLRLRVLHRRKTSLRGQRGKTKANPSEQRGPSTRLPQAAEYINSQLTITEISGVA